MTNHNGIVKEQLLHMLFGAIIFIAIGVLATGLDLFAGMTLRFGVSDFTHSVLVFSAHGLLVCDLGLFAIYLIRSSVTLVKEMFK